MKISNIFINDNVEIAVKVEGGMVPVSHLETVGQELPKLTDDLIYKPDLMDNLKITIDKNKDKLDTITIPEENISFAPCVKQTKKIICIGLNYKPHVEETNLDLPLDPIVFGKYSNSLAGNKEDINIPKSSEQIDYEGELCLIIGKKAQNVNKEDALDYVYGYCVGNDVSARDLQFRSHQWLLGKSCDQFAPIGPYLVTKEEIKDVQDLNIKTFVNGVEKQSSNTKNMIFDCQTLIEDVSKHVTLEPGDVIMTGTPEGVILGYPEQKRKWLKNNDVVTVEIEKLGSLTNKFVDFE